MSNNTPHGGPCGSCMRLPCQCSSDWHPDFGYVFNKSPYWSIPYGNPYAAVELDYSIKKAMADKISEFPIGTEVKVESIRVEHNTMHVVLQIKKAEPLEFIALDIDGSIDASIGDKLYEELMSEPEAAIKGKPKYPETAERRGTCCDVDLDAFMDPSLDQGVTCKSCHDFNEYCNTPSESDGTHLCYKCRNGY